MPGNNSQKEALMNMLAEKESVGERLVRIRQERGLSQEDFARELNLSVEELELVEQDKLDIFEGILVSIGKILGWNQLEIMDLSMKTHMRLEEAKPKTDMRKIISDLISEEIPDPYNFVKEIVALSFDNACFDIPDEDLLELDLLDLESSNFWNCIMETFPDFDPATYKRYETDYDSTVAALIDSILIAWDGKFPENIRIIDGKMFFQLT